MDVHSGTCDAVTTGTDRTKELRTLTDLVIAGDPLAPRLPAAERSRRLVAALSQTIERLDGCRTRDPAAASSAALAPVLEDARTLSTTLGASGNDHCRGDRNRFRYRRTKASVWPSGSADRRTHSTARCCSLPGGTGSTIDDRGADVPPPAAQAARAPAVSRALDCHRDPCRPVRRALHARDRSHQSPVLRTRTGPPASVRWCPP